MKPDDIENINELLSMGFGKWPKQNLDCEPIDYWRWKYARAVQVSGSYAYLDDGEDGLRIIDISNPADLQDIGYYDTPEPSNAKDIFLSGGYDFMGDGPSNLLLVIDVSDPAKPELAGKYETLGFVWSAYITESHAYVANGEHGMLILLLSIA